MRPVIFDLAHGVGTVYELPLPLSMYLFGAAATVVVSFFVRALMPAAPRQRDETLVASGSAVLALVTVLRVTAVAALLLAVAAGALVDEGGLTTAALLFWVCWIVGTTILCVLVGGAWEEIDPWRTIERWYRVADVEVPQRTPPWWLGPVLLYLLFWFELVLEVDGRYVGFQPMGIVGALLLYTIFAFTFRASLGEHWRTTDPASILFGFASSVSPLRVESGRLYYRGLLGGVDVAHAMSLSLFTSVFVLLGSTTLDNVRETVGWSDLRKATGLGDAPNMLVDSVALLAFAGLFFAPFLLAMAVTQRSIARDDRLLDVARRFGWSLIPIGIAYVLAHNAPLVMTGLPQLVRSLSDPFALGWNLLGTATAFTGYLPSPRLVWFLEIVLIVGGHILAVVAAHRTALRIGGSHRAAVRSQIAVTLLMSIYTISTLWLLAQPLVA